MRLRRIPRKGNKAAWEEIFCVMMITCGIGVSEGKAYPVLQIDKDHFSRLSKEAHDLS